MSAPETWWSSPRRVTVVVDNDSWILPFAKQLVEGITANGDVAVMARSHDDVPAGEIAFYLGCVKITPPEVLARNKRNLVVHASDLPKGRGFSPLTWQIIEGLNAFPICLILANERVDEGPIVYRQLIELRGDELLAELHDVVGDFHVSLAMRYLKEPQEPQSKKQTGEPTYYKRRCPEDSRLDPHKSIAEQFNQLRTVDNEKYPAFMDFLGCRYILKVKKIDPKSTS